MTRDSRLVTCDCPLFLSVRVFANNDDRLIPRMLNFVRRAYSGPVHPGDLERALTSLGLDGRTDAIIHSSLSSFGYVYGGAPSLIETLQSKVRTILTPAFSYYTLVWPEHLRQSDWPKHLPVDGPIFRTDSPVSSDIGRIPQTLLERSQAQRSSHPALSFLALGEQAEKLLRVQSLENPYAPIGALYQLDGDVLLLGVDHRSNTTIHYGEYLAGRPLLDRYANSKDGTVHTYFPNCSAAFNILQSKLESLETVDCGKAVISRMKVRDVVDSTVRLLEKNPEALLCTYQGCRCQTVRDKIRKRGLEPRFDWVFDSIG
jgi:aminoglycoside 3-N-acetyltransferase